MWKNERSSFLWVSPNTAFCVYKKRLSPISSKSLSNCREINQKLLVAYTEEFNSHLRHTYRDKCGKLVPISSLGNMSLCVNYPFLSNYLRNQPENWATKPNVQLVKAWLVQFVSNGKKDKLAEKCCNRRFFFLHFVLLKTTKRNIMITLHSLYTLHQDALANGLVAKTINLWVSRRFRPHPFLQLPPPPPQNIPPKTLENRRPGKISTQ